MGFRTSIVTRCWSNASNRNARVVSAGRADLGTRKHSEEPLAIRVLSWRARGGAPGTVGAVWVTATGFSEAGTWLSDRVAPFVSGTSAGVYGEVLGWSLLLWLFAAFCGFVVTSWLEEKDQDDLAALVGLLCGVLQPVAFLAALSAVVGLAYGKVPEVFIVSIAVAVFTERFLSRRS